MNENSVCFQPFVKQRAPSRGLYKYNWCFMKLHFSITIVYDSKVKVWDLRLFYLDLGLECKDLSLTWEQLPPAPPLKLASIFFQWPLTLLQWKTPLQLQTRSITTIYGQNFGSTEVLYLWTFLDPRKANRKSVMSSQHKVYGPSRNHGLGKNYYYYIIIYSLGHKTQKFGSSHKHLVHLSAIKNSSYLFIYGVIIMFLL